MLTFGEKTTILEFGVRALIFGVTSSELRALLLGSWNLSYLVVFGVGIWVILSFLELEFESCRFWSWNLSYLVVFGVWEKGDNIDIKWFMCSARESVKGLNGGLLCVIPGSMCGQWGKPAASWSGLVGQSLSCWSLADWIYRYIDTVCSIWCIFGVMCLVCIYELWVVLYLRVAWVIDGGGGFLSIIRSSGYTHDHARP